MTLYCVIINNNTEKDQRSFINMFVYVLYTEQAHLSTSGIIYIHLSNNRLPFLYLYRYRYAQDGYRVCIEFS